MKTPNYLAKLPQETTIKKIETLRDYDRITLHVPAPKQRLCPYCGSTDCIIKDSGAWQTVRYIPYHHRGSAERLNCYNLTNSIVYCPWH